LDVGFLSLVSRTGLGRRKFEEYPFLLECGGTCQIVANVPILGGKSSRYTVDFRRDLL
jgi:hypothetical protein